jgi:methionine-rich copper-binding protein CopC
MSAAAHVDLVSSTPPAGANLEVAPTRVTLTFDGELDPAGSSFTVTDPQGEEVGSGTVDLQVADRNVLDGEVAISEPGVYTVAWSVLGVDGHEIAGSFTFGYATAGAGTPDTAASMVEPAPASALTIAGMLLVVLAGLRLIRSAAVR